MFSQQFPDFRFPLNPDQKMLLTLPAQFSFPLCAGCVPRGDVPFPLFSLCLRSASFMESMASRASIISVCRCWEIVSVVMPR